MSRSFIQKNLFSMINEFLEETIITIEMPVISKDGLYECDIKFSNVKKYNATSKGVDEFNALESALDYVRIVCNNSDDPEFFVDESESMKGFFPKVGSR